ncbi:MAG: hypothetical protein ACUVSS_14655 [Anaerolineae bacterium]
MAQAISDTLPIDAGAQKFLAPVDPTSGRFVLLWAVAAQTFASKEFAALGTLPVWRTDTTHAALSVGTTPLKRGTGGSSTAAVDARGFNRCTVFVSVSGLDPGATLAVDIVPRYTQTGEDYSPAIEVAGALSDGYHAIEVTVNAPYLMVEATTSSGMATVTISVYLHR